MENGKWKKQKNIRCTEFVIGNWKLCSGDWSVHRCKLSEHSDPRVLRPNAAMPREASIRVIRDTTLFHGPHPVVVGKWVGR
jgi:hypothetical protein